MKKNKITSSQLKRYWKKLDAIEEDFYRNLKWLEEGMERETGIKGIEFIWCDNEIVGIGDYNRSMKLIHRG